MGEIAAGLALSQRAIGEHARREADRAACAPAFDKRPGFLDPTRLGPAREGGAPPVAIAGKRDSAGWKVLATIGGFQVLLLPEAARALAAELSAMADICDGKRW